MAARVLVVDDEPDIRELLELMLGDDGRCEQVVAVGRLDDVMPAATELGPDVVILDLMFGRRTCAEILPPLRAVCPAAHVVVFTSSRRAAMSLGVLGLGADVIVQKVSVSFDDLIDVALDPPLHLEATETTPPAAR